MAGNSLKHTVFLTGATGFLGTEISCELIASTECDLFVLVRGADAGAARQRLLRAWSDRPELAQAIGGRVVVLAGDVAAPRLGLTSEAYDLVVRSITHIIHSAADVRLDAPLDELRATNVTGTARVIELARAIQRDHGLTRLAHVSTAYVAGRRKGAVAESDLTDRYGFASNYERSKYEAELLVREAGGELPVSVFRPGMVVGDSRTGEIKTFNTLYYPLRLYLTGRLPVAPVPAGMRANLVPVDYVARAIAALAFAPEAAGLTFHLTAPYDTLPPLADLLDFVRAWARARLGVQLPRARFMNLPQPALRLGLRALRAVPWFRKKGLTGLATLAPYYEERRLYRRDNTDRLLGRYEFNWRAALPPILDYAASKGFLHRSGRTVHEQVLFRLGSKSRPITYFDIVDGKPRRREAAEVRADILAATAGLRALGVRPGDRVAIVGLNSTRYLALDVAIGLAGAVSVPLYYTSPPHEVEQLVKSSGARVLLVGTPHLLARLDEAKLDLPVVSFCRATASPQAEREVISWKEFLSRGRIAAASTPAPLSLTDLATIRYTSGTTGKPKGVCFNHASLTWMGETLASLVPWRVRNSRASYLSFLPMNHVVEGILAMYSSYYLPAAVEIYFLEDFRDLQRALPLVRPNIFFSVTRFYEKVWDGFSQSLVGRCYARLNGAPLKRLVRPLVRGALLRRIGLDRCAQLIVGSSPSGEDLLRAYHDLGIEVHNAYGLTEAPLVTMNRLGRNCLGTVGEPLPDTDLRLAEDGEILVRGPQVTVGYFEQGVEQPFAEGWLRTGDLGEIDGQGRLLISGRKKELIVTSYGKKVHPAKVEAMLRDIRGVDEALLVGEGRPYCAALLWVKPERKVNGWAAALDRSVCLANARLSNPEQVKRWLVLEDDLSIAGGELTASLKLKRNVVSERKAGLLDALYEGVAQIEGVLHTGFAGRVL